MWRFSITSVSIYLIYLSQFYIKLQEWIHKNGGKSPNRQYYILWMASDPMKSTTTFNKMCTHLLVIHHVVVRKILHFLQCKLMKFSFLLSVQYKIWGKAKLSNSKIQPMDIWCPSTMDKSIFSAAEPWQPYRVFKYTATLTTVVGIQIGISSMSVRINGVSMYTNRLNVKIILQIIFSMQTGFMNFQKDTWDTRWIVIQNASNYSKTTTRASHFAGLL